MVKRTRREFLKGSAALGTGLVIGLNIDGVLAGAGNAAFIPNPFVKVLPDNTVIVIAKHFEMGQGTTTGLATLVAEELEADWSQVKVDWAPADAKLYANFLFKAQGTGGSTAIANSFQQYRQAGAMAKQLLIEAAAEKWKVPASEIVANNGVLKHSSGKSAKFGELAGDAAKRKPGEISAW